MKAFTMNAFPIPIVYGNFGEESKELNKSLVQDALHSIETQKAEQRSGVHVDQTSYGLEGKYTSFEQLASLIQQFAEGYIRQAGVKKELFKVYDFWANLNQNPSAYHMPHSHSFHAGMFTGVYFPTSGWWETEDGQQESVDDYEAEVYSSSQPKPGNLVFLDPLEYVKTALATPSTEKYPYFGNPICIAPKEGTIVLFPSYLSHLVTPTERENWTRMSIAFNIKVLV